MEKYLVLLSILIVYTISFSLASVCPFEIPSFTCTVSRNILHRLPVSVASIKKTLSNRSKSPYLNFAAPILRLHISEIKSLATFGDSISAGLFVTTESSEILKVKRPVEERSLSWSSGGASYGRIVTLYNAIKRISPQLEGGSFGSTKRRENSMDISKIGLNMAISSQQTETSYEQAEKYIKILSNMTTHSDQWKMGNVFIGSNDLCRSCERVDRQPARIIFEKGVRKLIETLRTGGDGNVGKKMLVNLYGLPDLTPLKYVGSDVPFCAAARRLAKICPCVLQANETDIEAVQNLRNEFNGILKAVAMEYQTSYLQNLLNNSVSNTHQDAFVVFYQPAFVDLSIGDGSLSFVSPVDCFHPNHCGQQAMSFPAFNSYSIASEHGKRQTSIVINEISKNYRNYTGDYDGRETQQGNLKHGQNISSTLSRGRLFWKCPSDTDFIQ